MGLGGRLLRLWRPSWRRRPGLECDTTADTHTTAGGTQTMHDADATTSPSYVVRRMIYLAIYRASDAPHTTPKPTRTVPVIGHWGLASGTSPSRCRVRRSAEVVEAHNRRGDVPTTHQRRADALCTHVEAISPVAVCTYTHAAMYFPLRSACGRFRHNK